MCTPAAGQTYLIIKAAAWTASQALQWSKFSFIAQTLAQNYVLIGRYASSQTDFGAFLMNELGLSLSNMPTPLEGSPAASRYISTVVTDINLSFGTEINDPPGYVPYYVRWRCIKKELYLHMAESTAWLYLAEAKENELIIEDLVITDVRVGN